MQGFLSRIWKLYQEDKKAEKQRQLILAQGPTEHFIRELMNQAEQGVECRLEFPGGAHLVITRKHNSVTTHANGIQLREDYLG